MNPLFASITLLLAVFAGMPANASEFDSPGDAMSAPNIQVQDDIDAAPSDNVPASEVPTSPVDE